MAKTMRLVYTAICDIANMRFSTFCTSIVMFLLGVVLGQSLAAAILLALWIITYFGIAIWFNRKPAREK